MEGTFVTRDEAREAETVVVAVAVIATAASAEVVRDRSIAADARPLAQVRPVAAAPTTSGNDDISTRSRVSSSNTRGAGDRKPPLCSPWSAQRAVREKPQSRGFGLLLVLRHTTNLRTTPRILA